MSKHSEVNDLNKKIEKITTRLAQHISNLNTLRNRREKLWVQQFNSMRNSLPETY